MTFGANLAVGQAGESAIAAWLRSRGHTVLPAYEKIIDNGKGPRLFTPAEPLVVPDLLVFKSSGETVWVEAKHKTAFSWHRNTERWVTGIDLHHYDHYLRVAETLPIPVMLLFLQEGKQAKDGPPDSPAGLYGGDLKYLAAHENHRHTNWGRHGMVYWSIEVLRRLASLEDLVPPAPDSGK